MKRRHLKIGGEQVGYNRSTRSLRLAGEDWPVKDWLEFRRQIDLLMAQSLKEEDWKKLREELAWLGKRDRLPPELQDYRAQDQHQVANNFISRNFEMLNEVPSNRTVMRTPWWLRWLAPLMIVRGKYGN